MGIFFDVAPPPTVMDTLHNAQDWRWALACPTRSPPDGAARTRPCARRSATAVRMGACGPVVGPFPFDDPDDPDDAIGVAMAS